MAHCVESLKQWTGKASANIVYDSRVDPFTDQGLFDMVKGKPNIAIIATTLDGDVFGGYYSVSVTGQCQCVYDPNMFAFSFDSRGRCETPKMFAVKAKRNGHGYVSFLKKDSDGCFVAFWVYDCGGFYLGNERSNSYCFDMSKGFEGLQDTTLTGKLGGCFNVHRCTRLVAIQLE